MEQQELETVVKNIDQRVGRIEQILPTLATKEDLRAAIQPLATRAEMHEAIETAIQKAVEPLVTRPQMDEAIQRAIEPLATKVDMREEGERTRRYFDVVAEGLRAEIRLIAEGQTGLQQRFEELRADLKADITRLDRRLMRLEAAR